MWPELFPFLAIMGAGLWLPTYGHLAVNWLFFNGHHQARTEFKNIREYYGFRRDEYLVGSMYKAAGLEAIPDEKQQ